MKISDKNKTKLYFRIPVLHFNQQKLEKWCEEKGFDFNDENLVSIAIQALRMNALGIPAPFSSQAANKGGYHLELKGMLKHIAKTFKGKVNPYSQQEGKSREIEIPQETARLEWEMVTKMFDESQKTIRSLTKIAKEYNEVVTREEINLNIQPYVKYLNSVRLDFDYLITNCDERINQLATLPFSKSLASRILLIKKLRDEFSIKNVSYAHGRKSTSDKYRIYTTAQNLSYEDRATIFKREDNYFEVDLTACHLNIINMLTGLNIPNARQNIINETSLSKEKVKRVINDTLYSGGFKLIQAELINDEILREQVKAQIEKAKIGDRAYLMQRINAVLIPEQALTDYAALKASKTFRAIKAGIKALTKKIETDRGMVDAFGEFVPMTNKKSTLSAVCFSYEKALIMPIADLTSRLGFQISFDHHDGFTCLIKNNDRVDAVITAMKACVEKTAKKLKINTQLEVK